MEREPVALTPLDVRLKVMLPEEYQESYEQMQPAPMRSAGLKYDADGKVAWDEIWGSFCDLAMAGGPPHKGMLLEPASRAEIEAQPERYAEVTDEICRGVEMVTGLMAYPAATAGWIRVSCLSEEMAGWLLRAIAMENVAVRREGRAIELPASPGYRLEKEIKNVVTVIAKTCHYWVGHMPAEQKCAIAELFATMDRESPLVVPQLAGDGEDEEVAADRLDRAATRIADSIYERTGLRRSRHRYRGWLGLDCPTIPAALWMMRTLVASNILSRREGTTVFVPVNPATDPGGKTVVTTLARLHALAVSKALL